MLIDEYDSPAKPVPLAPHIPDQLTITLWDFSWYVRTGPGEPFEDLDAAFAGALQRGYNTIRICAMPFLLFGTDIDTSALKLGPLGGGYAQHVRWYDVKTPTVIDARQHLLALFEAAKKHDVFVIVSSWEYQQSSAFAEDRAWFDALMAVPPEERAERLAEAHANLIAFLREHDLDDRIAFVELHNEVQAGHLTEGLEYENLDEATLALRPRLTRGIDRFHELAPGVPCSVNYAHVPVGGMRGIPWNSDVLVVHPYIYGVLDDFIRDFALRRPIEEFEQERAAETFLLDGAPPIAEWTLPPESQWKLTATIVGKGEIYAHDWGDAERIDLFLYEHYGRHQLEMEATLKTWIAVAADHAAMRGIPLVFGEGWVGYTPLEGRFEEGPVGAEYCRLAMRESRRVGARGSIVCSNAAPQHPMWDDVALQLECNAIFTAAP
ncbi:MULTISPECIES: cellulase-like family protein [unclassified Rathayibacter]|uniref:cellulase-like family protein n=1 Tax=unclassified Rathayibacter TaxID=2609250 RepID=UPI0006F82DE0|nr:MULTISPECIES: cellulase-like family protein [unclassified Rathayibacter]KQQ05559.1 aromatic ring-opening dioxygenase LigA [Rathayibacter sp. Leaf294]KQS13422.1 aromatic ring-opening dioxygenase LigA [Rathayibacter sp. Leaf185]